MRQAQLSQFANELHAASAGDVVVARVDGYAGEQLRTLAQDLQRRGRRVVVVVGESSTTRSRLAVATDGSLDAASPVSPSRPTSAVAEAAPRVWRSRAAATPAVSTPCSLRRRLSKHWMARLLGFDPGTVRCGVAITDSCHVDGVSAARADEATTTCIARLASAR